MGDCDDTEILVTETTIQTANTDDLGIQTSKEAISQLPNQSETVIPVEEKSETTEEQQIIAGKMIGANNFYHSQSSPSLFHKNKNGKGLTSKNLDIDSMSHSIVLLVSFSGICSKDKLKKFTSSFTQFLRKQRQLVCGRW